MAISLTMVLIAAGDGGDCPSQHRCRNVVALMEIECAWSRLLQGKGIDGGVACVSLEVEAQRAVEGCLHEHSAVDSLVSGKLVVGNLSGHLGVVVHDALDSRRADVLQGVPEHCGCNHRVAVDHAGVGIEENASIHNRDIIAGNHHGIVHGGGTGVPIDPDAEAAWTLQNVVLESECGCSLEAIRGQSLEKEGGVEAVGEKDRVVGTDVVCVEALCRLPQEDAKKSIDLVVCNDHIAADLGG